jgi:hypothetical protein
MTYYTRSIALLALLVTTTSCSAYRTNSDLSFDTTALSAEQTDTYIPINIDVAGRSYDDLGTVKAVVKKRTAFHKSPTREQANIVLGYEAKKLGADAVIDVKYDTGIAFDSWGKMEAIGTAIKFTQ